MKAIIFWGECAPWLINQGEHRAKIELRIDMSGFTLGANNTHDNRRLMMKSFQNTSHLFMLVLSFMVLLGGIYGINMSNKLAICSPFFVLTLITTLGIAKIVDIKTAWISTLSALMVNLLFQWTALKWVHVFSFMGIFCAVHIGLHFFERLSSLSLPVRLFISLGCAVLMDAVIMLPWEVYTFPMAKVWSVCFRSLLYKISYAGAISLGYGAFSFYTAKIKTLKAYKPKNLSA